MHQKDTKKIKMHTLHYVTPQLIDFWMTVAKTPLTEPKINFSILLFPLVNIFSKHNSTASATIDCCWQIGKTNSGVRIFLPLTWEKWNEFRQSRKSHLPTDNNNLYAWMSQDFSINFFSLDFQSNTRHLHQHLGPRNVIFECLMLKTSIRRLLWHLFSTHILMTSPLSSLFDWKWSTMPKSLPLGRNEST